MQKTSEKKTKIVHENDIEKTFRKIQNKKIVLVGGCFDLFHFGHLCFLKKAREQGDILTILLESDDFIIRSKHRRPTHTQKQRVEILSALDVVDYIIPMSHVCSMTDYNYFVEKIRPSVIAVTAGDSKLNEKSTQAGMVGAKLKVVIKQIKKFSTTKIINK